MTNVTKYCYWGEKEKRGTTAEKERKDVLMGGGMFDERGEHGWLVLEVLWLVVPAVLQLMVPPPEAEVM